jgi:hypothetical protein
VEITDPFDQSIQGCEFMSFIESNISSPVCFFAVSLSSGYYLTWNFYPEIYTKLQALNQSKEFFKSAIMQYSQMIKLGEFVLQHSGHLVLNLQHEVVQLKPVRNSTKNGYRLSGEKLTIPGRKD